MWETRIVHYLAGGPGGNEVLILGVHPVAVVPLDQMVIHGLHVVVEVADVSWLCLSDIERK